MTLTDVARHLFPDSVWDRLRRWRWARRIARYQPREARHIYAGVPLTVWLADPMAEAWYDGDWSALPELDGLPRLKTGARVFDLGAHHGVVALVLADRVGPTGSVVAVEAGKHNAAVAARNRDRNGAAHLTVVHGAIAAVSGPLRFNEATGRLSSGGCEARGWTIDDLARQYGLPDVIVMDVDGYESSALQGAGWTLGHRTDWWIEVHVGAGLEALGGSAAAVVATFPIERYNLLIAPGGAVDAARTFVPFDPASPVVRSRFFLLALAK